MTAEQTWGVIRTILAAVGGFIVAKGYIDAESFNAILGAVGTIFVAVWSIMAKRAA